MTHEFKVIEQKLDHITSSINKISNTLESMNTKITQMDKEQNIHDYRLNEMEREMKISNAKQIDENKTLDKRIDKVESVVDNGHGMLRLLSLISLGISILIGITTIGGFL